VEEPNIMPKQPRVLVVGRRRDLVDSAVTWGQELGFDARAALSNDEALKLLGSGQWAAVALGCVFQNDERYKEEYRGLRATLENRGIPHGDMPTFGNIKAVLEDLNLQEHFPKKKSIGAPVAAAIAG
jgi:hypothetical protein